MIVPKKGFCEYLARVVLKVGAGCDRCPRQTGFILRCTAPSFTNYLLPISAYDSTSTTLLFENVIYFIFTQGIYFNRFPKTKQALKLSANMQMV